MKHPSPLRPLPPQGFKPTRPWTPVDKQNGPPQSSSKGLRLGLWLRSALAPKAETDRERDTSSSISKLCSLHNPFARLSPDG